MGPRLYTNLYANSGENGHISEGQEILYVGMVQTRNICILKQKPYPYIFLHYSSERTLSRRSGEPLRISLSAIGDFLNNWIISGKP